MHQAVWHHHLGQAVQSQDRHEGGPQDESLQSIVARKYLATTTLVPPQWGTLWGGALDAED